MGVLSWLVSGFQRALAPRPPPVRRREEPRTPVDPPAASSAPKGIAGTLEKSNYGGAALEALIQRLRKASANVQDADERMLYSGVLRVLQNGAVNLPAMPKAVLRIQRMIDAPDCEIPKLVGVIAREPVVATKLVGIANSALYCPTTPVRGLREAVMRIGLRETRNVVLAIIAQSKLFRVPGHESEADDIYQHALACSLAAQLVGEPLGFDPDEAFLAGLIHDLGRVVVLSIASDLARQSRNRELLSPVTIEVFSDAFHADLSAVVAEWWNFSPMLTLAVQYHHAPDDAPPEAMQLARVLHEADLIADRVTGQMKRRAAGEQTETPVVEAEAPPSDPAAELLIESTKVKYSQMRT